MARYLTARERAAQQRGRDAVARAQAIAAARQATPDHDDPWPAWPPTPAAWRLRCRQIRDEIEENR